MIRVGTGFDSHRLSEGRRLVLGGVEIPHSKGLLGHSDADALAHAIIDALLGAVADGDIGQHFPDRDPQWKDADSMVLLAATVERLRGAGWGIVNIDSTVLAEAPKLRPYIDAMRERLAAAMGIDVGCVSVKAKTNEGMDAVGNREGIAVQAVALEMGLEPAAVTGRGAGLTDAGLIRKVEAIRRAIEVNRPDPADALDVLSKVGGLDIAGICGAFLGGAIHRVPILIDGFISAVGALAALRLAPESRCAMLAAHVSAEPAARMVLEALELKPLITAGLRLGEGTGAVAALPLLDMALAVYDGMVTFENIGMDAYEVDLK